MEVHIYHVKIDRSEEAVEPDLVLFCLSHHVSELNIREGIEDNSKITFLISQQKH